MIKPDLLLITHRIPYPPDKGDKIRSWNLLRHLCGQWRVHLGCFVDDAVDQIHQPFLDSMTGSTHFVPLNPTLAKIRSASGLLTGKPLSLAYYASSSMQNYVADTRRQFQPAVEIAFSSSMAPFILSDNTSSVRIIDFCDSDAEKWRAYAEVKKGIEKFIYSREAKLLADCETKFANASHTSFAITLAEAALFNNRQGVSKKVDFWENGVDTEYYNPDIECVDKAAIASDMVFVGAMDYQPNIDAVVWFSQEVLPYIQENLPDATFTIVGSKPTTLVRQLEKQDGIHVTGRVSDVRPWLKSAKIVVAPLRVARGIQNKVLEAMAMSKSVIATTDAATGISAEPKKEIMIVDNPDAMANTILNFLQQPEKRSAMGSAARNCVLKNYSWSSKLQRLDSVLADKVTT